ncbi:molecular chaperone (plasmid) [Klebsiella pasteurii]|uniref:fimbrial biogenesis chaperone n=1 Tax=Klebsiella pasteurii TaxID=2587529 RepID=UPI002542A6EA|nr:molecular chaperone [Klebsiella pasteurii]WII85142.1 molecular chaperone [Klebsiella pasteurii]
MTGILFSKITHCILKPLFLFGGCILFMIGLSLNSEAAKNELQGTFFESTRLIYPEDALHGKSIVLNNNSDKDFLLQAYVSHIDVETGLPTLPSKEFLVTPPLMHLGAHQIQNLRLLRTAGDFPTDRESVFFLTARLIPNERTDSEKNISASHTVVKFLTSLTVKVFWRPHGLDKPNAVEDSAGKLKADIVGNTLILKNPTPYYVTLRTLSIGGSDVQANELMHMVPPYGTQRYSLPIGTKRSSVTPVTWTAIKENGFDTISYSTHVNAQQISSDIK